MAEKKERVAVIGGGIMGHGITQVFATHGHPVALVDVSDEVLKASIHRIEENLRQFIERGLTTKEKAAETVANISPTTDISAGLSDVDVAVEVIPEKMELKKEMFAKMDELTPPHAVLTTNTSTLLVTEIAAATKRPDKVVGTHFMIPPHILPLLEVMRAEQTSDETLTYIVDLGERIGKKPIVCKDVPGFIVNRLQLSLWAEALSLVDKGICSIDDVDRAVNSHLGYRYCLFGPFEVMDFVGIDTAVFTFEYMYKATGEEKYKMLPALEQKFKDGDLGWKTGKGYRDYSGQSVDDLLRRRNERVLDLLTFLKVEF